MAAMKLSRRTFVHTGAAAGIGLSAACAGSPETAQAQTPAPASAAGGAPPSIASLKPMTADVKPITADERAARIEKAQQDDGAEQDRRDLPRGRLEHVLLHRRSLGPERAAVRLRHPGQKGEPAWVCPGFEEERARELVGKTAEVRVWQEDESPYRQVAGILKDRGAAGRRWRRRAAALSSFSAA